MRKRWEGEGGKRTEEMHERGRETKEKEKGIERRSRYRVVATKGR